MIIATQNTSNPFTALIESIICELWRKTGSSSQTHRINARSNAKTGSAENIAPQPSAAQNDMVASPSITALTQNTGAGPVNPSCTEPSIASGPAQNNAVAT